jgi:hypothetical protein
MKTLLVKIVGLKHRGVTTDEIYDLIGGQIRLEREPDNKFDGTAVRCLFGDRHIGYIEADQSARVTKFIQQTGGGEVEILDFDDYAIKVRIVFAGKEVSTAFDKLSDGDRPGIYRISFRSDGTLWRYVGQSTNINKRLSAHYRDLANECHHNSILQEAWLRNSKSFEHRILENCPDGLNALSQQIWLFRRELHHITAQSDPTANRLDADLVLTTESYVELKQLVAAIKLEIKSRRKALVLAKELIGQKFFDLGIMKEERFWDGWQRAGEPNRYLTVKASNVLSWIKKVPRSGFERMPSIKRDHPKYDGLKELLIAEHRKINQLDAKKKFVEQFPSGLKSKGNYETCAPGKLETFLDIAEEMKD